MTGGLPVLGAASMGVIGEVRWAWARTHWGLHSILLIWTVTQVHGPKASPFKHHLSPAPDKWKRTCAGIHLFAAQLDSKSRNLFISLWNALVSALVHCRLPALSLKRVYEYAYPTSKVLSKMSHIRDKSKRIFERAPRVTFQRCFLLCKDCHFNWL